MHESHPIEHELKKDAQAISDRYGGAPVVILVAGDRDAGVPATMTASVGLERLRDLLGVLQAAIQIESWKHLPGKGGPGPG